MIRNILNIIVISLFAVVLFSCNNNSGKQQNTVDKQKLTQKEMNAILEDANRYWLAQESELIEDYISRQELDMIKTGTDGVEGSH